MSRNGIKECSRIFQDMQETRMRLLSGDKQDVFLGQMLDIGKDAMKIRFCEATMKASTPVLSASEIMRSAGVPNLLAGRRLNVNTGKRKAARRKVRKERNGGTNGGQEKRTP